MKKILCGSVFALIATGAMADGFYINPQVAYSITSVSENRVEKSSQNGVWAEFDGNKHESWSDTGHKFSPKIAVGYEFDMDKAGILSVEAEYGHVDNFFNAIGFDAAEDGAKPNDTDVRNFTYNESTLGLNVKYGYEVYKFIPYVTAGIGYTTIESENNFRSGRYFWETPATTENMSWNVGVGIEVPVTDNVAFNIAYKYTDLGSVEYTNGMFYDDHKANQTGMTSVFDSDVDLYKHEIIAGVKMSF